MLITLAESLERQQFVLCVFILSVISVIVFVVVVVVVVRNAVHRLVVIRDLKIPVFGVRIRVLVSTGRRYLARRNGWVTG